MTDLSITISPETVNDAQAIERLHERTFGPGRFVLSAYRLREDVDHLLELSFTARIGTLLVGSVRQLPVCVGDTAALVLGPPPVRRPPFRKPRHRSQAARPRAVGRQGRRPPSRASGRRRGVLQPRVGFKPVPKGQRPCPVRSTTGAFSLPSWSMAPSRASPA